MCKKLELEVKVFSLPNSLTPPLRLRASDSFHAGYGRIRIFNDQEKSRNQIVLRYEYMQIRSLVASLFLAYATNEVLYICPGTHSSCCHAVTY